MSTAVLHPLSYWCVTEDYHDRCNGRTVVRSRVDQLTYIADCRCECHKIACAPHDPLCEVAGDASRDAVEDTAPVSPASRLAQLSYIEARNARWTAIDACQEMHRVVQTDETTWHSLSGLVAQVTDDEDVRAAVYERFNGLQSSKPLSFQDIASEYEDADQLAEALFALTRCEGPHGMREVEAAPGSLLCAECQAEAGQPDPMDMEGDR